MLRLYLQRFLKLEAAGGIILFIAALLAMIMANSPLAPYQARFIDRFLFFINEGLMAIFFLQVGLELKRGYLDGYLAKLHQILLPLAGAIGGMIVPALIYCAVNIASPETLKGWATPVATDIAFAIGVLSLFGKRIPLELKLFLLTLAIFDDIGAILIIAVFYSHGFSTLYLFLSAVVTGMLWYLNHRAVRSLIPYLLCGVLLWFGMLRSGVHPTIAGVIVALFIPQNAELSIHSLSRLEVILHPWVTYLIMPLFAMANAGVSFSELTWEMLTDTVVIGITLGLFLGKQIGVTLFSWSLIKLKLGKLPENSTWPQFYGVALLCGIGFTMSLFLGTLSFANETVYLAEVRIGVILGSLLSGLAGSALLGCTRQNHPQLEGVVR